MRLSLSLGFAHNLIKVLDAARQDISEMGVPPDTVSVAFEALDKMALAT